MIPAHFKLLRRHDPYDKKWPFRYEEPPTAGPSPAGSAPKTAAGPPATNPRPGSLAVHRVVSSLGVQTKVMEVDYSGKMPLIYHIPYGPDHQIHKKGTNHIDAVRDLLNGSRFRAKVLPRDHPLRSWY
eukprot:TRINITY_DN36244_c0_g1_i1.p1 TRINITY_DN36244_c0_g1~~TRINITY_DN36244_c0_g1_i1.p1  ORF type:complete len:128 (+),score=3.08 TRINITY_DN36244_c0_g1_i1:48-431(+)